MKNYGDITKIDGAKVPPVNAVIGGSPCQDLSIAGKRAGLDGERSGLFMEQLRIIKEMRENDRRNGRTSENARPRFMVWENVPGAFSSNKGEDFRVVLEETAKVADGNAVIPRPPKGKWITAGAVVGDGWSIAWRVLDAQFWGVPQRRRRIALVADFGGQNAPKILFECESLSRDSTESGTEGQGTTADIERSVDATGKGWAEDKSYTLNTIDRPAVIYENHSADSRVTGPLGTCPTVSASWGTGGNNTPLTLTGGVIAMTTGSFLKTTTDDKAATLCQRDYKSPQCVVHLEEQKICLNDQGGDIMNVSYDKTGTLSAEMHNHQPCILEQNCFSQDGYSDYNENDKSPSLKNSGGSYGGGSETLIIDGHGINGDIAGTLDSHYVNTLGQRGGKERDVVAVNTADFQSAEAQNNNYIVRRLTPLEGERLQGFPDGWTDIGEWTDSKGRIHKTADCARYKALGNSIAIPPWTYVLSKLSERCGDDKTMASLFDGIGGFPLIWERINGKGSCLWTSEIEDFCIAVTDKHFNDEGKVEEIRRIEE